MRMNKSFKSEWLKSKILDSLEITVNHFSVQYHILLKL